MKALNPEDNKNHFAICKNESLKVRRTYFKIIVLNIRNSTHRY